MPRVVPSQIVTFIETCFQRDPASLNLLQLGRAEMGQLAGLVELVEKIPDELLLIDGATYAALLSSVCHIRETLKFWTSGQDMRAWLSPVPAYRKHPVTIIYEVLSKCPDRAAVASTAELMFIVDPDFRETLRSDLSEVNRALADGEWKAATVLSGSVAEALLLWKLQSLPPAEISRVSNMVPNLPNKPLDRWHLPEYISAAERLNIFTADTIAQCKLAKDFRNLIHPGRARRLGQKCDRGAALSAVASVEHLVRELS
jgi:hypothetical protein